jgi:glycosyltransferase involved in cell wall biosynthesis
MKELIKRLLFDIFGIITSRRDKRIVSLRSGNNNKGIVLLSYVIDPFLKRNLENIPISHTKYWESLQIAKTFLEFGFDVDVINYDNSLFFPKKNYDIFIGSRVHFEKTAQRLNPDCIKIAHLTISHWCYNNKAHCERLLSVQKKKGVTIYPEKMAETNLAIEYADFATILGNHVTIDTYKYANKKIYPVRISTPVLFPWMANKNFDECRKNFLWFGSEGLVHKGLDIVLEVFSEMPNYNLTVCGPVSKEEDFERTYYKELYQTPNIKTVGWVDINSKVFHEIINNSIAFVYPSCAEGQSGGVVTCLHASLIPIVSIQSGVDISDDFGISLRQCTHDELKKSIIHVSQLKKHDLEKMAKKAWEFARENHTRETFSRDYKNAIVSILIQRNMRFNKKSFKVYAQ